MRVSRRKEMMMKRILIIFHVLLFASMVHAQSVSDYLILTDIAQYKLTKGLLFRGKVVGAEPKVSKVGNDVYGFYTSYETNYAGGEGYSAPTVEVRVYGSIQWLLHEVEDSYRDRDNSDGQLGMLSGAGVKIRDIGGSKFIYWGLGGGSYTWISGQKVIEIKYTDLQRTKPEPIEVVQAYLQKHPSTILTSFVFDQAHDVQWIKDEMDRRLWLCDKWFLQITLKKAEEKQVYQESVKSMNVFLDYREKYFSIKAADEKNLLAGYLNTNNGTGIKTKLTEYKNWWTVHKTDAISL